MLLKIFSTVLVACLLSSSTLAQPSGGKVMTANDVITNLNSISTVYEDFQGILATLNSCPSDKGPAADLVAEYTNITTSEVSDETAPQPPKRFSLAAQYGLVGASHSVVLEDRRFLIALQQKKSSFTWSQQKQLHDLIQKQVGVVNVFLKDVDQFAPDVESVILADDSILKATVRDAIGTFGG